MKSGFEREIRPVGGSGFRLRYTATARQDGASRVQPAFAKAMARQGLQNRVEFGALPSNMMGILCFEMWSKAVKPNQTNSSLLKMFLRKKPQRTWR
jgi:hypothetical protein